MDALRWTWYLPPKPPREPAVVRRCVSDWSWGIVRKLFCCRQADSSRTPAAIGYLCSMKRETVPIKEKFASAVKTRSFTKRSEERRVGKEWRFEGGAYAVNE